MVCRVEGGLERHSSALSSCVGNARCATATALPLPCQVPREAAFQAFSALGFPDWVIIGSLEIFDTVNAGCGGYAHDDFKDITGSEPTTVGQWVRGATREACGSLLHG
jgi:hypothetical protein